MQQNQFHLESCYLQILKQNKKSLVIFFNRQKKKETFSCFQEVLIMVLLFLLPKGGLITVAKT